MQSGDRISGGTGDDRLEADIGNSQAFAITAETTGIETVAIRAQAVSSDTTDNNTSSTNEVQIDAQRMVGVRQWESNNSRADLVIEDVRILDTQITKDITIAMVETDPGHVDFGVYFDQYSLRAQTNSSNVLRLQLMDTRSAADGEPPLKNNPYNGFAFFYNGELTTVTSSAIDAATTYGELLLAIQEAVAAEPKLADVEVTLGADFTVSDTLGTLQTGSEIVLTVNNGDTIGTSGPGAGWVAAGAVPPSSGLHTNMSTVVSNTVDPVTSKIILDDVGRGSTGGDLVVGGLSVGDTSTSLGVQRFEIEVRDNSKLQTINSTNNTLREVTIKNGVTSSKSHAYVTTEKDKGDLTVLGTVSSTIGINAPLPGSAAQHNTYGFSDVRLIDASAMTGNLNFNAEITTASIAKYINLIDNAANPGLDNIDFAYTGGLNDDTMDVTIDGAVLSSNSLLLAGREDFTFTANGGAGNDKISLKVVDGLLGNTEAWYNNQVLNANVTINGGDGDDTIATPGAGNVVINGDGGNDTIYVDNTGDQFADAVSPAPVSLVVAAPRAVYVLNTANQSNLTTAAVVGTYDIAVNEERNLADLKSDVNNVYNLHLSQLTVTFKGLTSTVTVPSTGYRTSDLQMNQAIKNAINNNAVLNKLLVVTDGPANTLVVTSLIDGVIDNTNFDIAIATPTAGTLSATDITAVATAYGLPAPATEADVLTAMAAAKTAFDTKADYVDQLAETGVNGGPGNVEITGAESETTSDNTVTGGAGNDVIVLGTTGQDEIDATYNNTTDQIQFSNDTVVFAAGFGNDVIVNFKADTDLDPDEYSAGYDVLNFVALGGTGANFAGTAVTDTHQSITVVAESLANDTIAEIAAFYTDDAIAETHVYVAYDANNVGKVYQVVDGTGTGNVVVTLAGTIDLADTDWSTLTASNFA